MNKSANDRRLTREEMAILHASHGGASVMARVLSLAEHLKWSVGVVLADPAGIIANWAGLFHPSRS